MRIKFLIIAALLLLLPVTAQAACWDTSPYTCTFGSAGGRDYSSLATWEAATDVDLSGYGVLTLDCYDDSASYNDGVVVSGATNTDSTHYRVIKSADGCSTPFDGTEGSGVYFNYSGAGLSISGSSVSKAGIALQESYARVVGIEVTVTLTNTNAPQGISAYYVGNNMKIINCLSHDNNNSASTQGYGFLLGANNAIPDPYDNFFYNCIASYNTIDGFGLHGDLHSTGDEFGAINCLAYNNGNFGFAVNNTALQGYNYIWNCYAFGNTNAGYDASVGDAGGWNASDSSNASLNGNAAYYYNSLDLSGSFNDAANGDFSWTASTDASTGSTGDGNCGRSPIDDLSGTWNPDSFFTTDPLADLDIAGNSRPSGTDAAWDVGPFEYTGGGGGGDTYTPVIIVVQ